jgi:Cysteine-rich CWC
MDDSAPRPLTCARCGVPFDCGLGGDCWCAAEPFRLPMPKPAPKLTPEPGSVEDCLCPICLRAAASATAAQDIH